MDVNLLSDERRKREVSIREQARKAVGRVPMAEPGSERAAEKRTAPVPTETQHKAPPPAATPRKTSAVKEQADSEALPWWRVGVRRPPAEARISSQKSRALPPPAVSPAPPPRFPSSKSSPLNAVRPLPPTPAFRAIEYASLIAIVTVTFVSGLGFGVALTVAPAAPVEGPDVRVIRPVGSDDAVRVLRDELRLSHMSLIVESLGEYWRAHAASYPAGERVVLGTPDTSCLSAAGWVTHDRCAVPSNPFDNQIHLDRVPADPTDGQYRYTALENGAGYRLDFILEVGVGGYEAGPQRMFGGAVPRSAIE